LYVKILIEWSNHEKLIGDKMEQEKARTRLANAGDIAVDEVGSVKLLNEVALLRADIDHRSLALGEERRAKQIAQDIEGILDSSQRNGWVIISSRASFLLSQMYFWIGQGCEGFEHSVSALEGAKYHPSVANVARTLANLGLAYVQSGHEVPVGGGPGCVAGDPWDVEFGLGLFDQALDILREEQDASGMGYAWVTRGCALRGKDQDEARRSFKEAQDIYDELGNANWSELMEKAADRLAVSDANVYDDSVFKEACGRRSDFERCRATLQFHRCGVNTAITELQQQVR
jgi:hypothetical protein